MRRIAAAIVLIAFIGQTSGSAVAATDSGHNAVTRTDVVDIIASIQAFVQSSPAYAALTGTSDRYAATHHAPPRVHVQEDPTHLTQPLPVQRIHPRIRLGVRQHIAMPPMSALRMLRRDPLTMPRGERRPGPIRFGRNAQGRLNSVLGPNLFQIAESKNGAMSPMTVTTAPNNGTTGVNHWWSYEQRPIPGLGEALLNVGTGNLLVTSTDVDIPEVGIDLAFRRIYNSQSKLDVNNDDTTGRAIYGNRWTNTFNADMVYNKTANTITVYDIDGTQCTYTATTSSAYPTGWKPCEGEYATLGPTDTTDCTYAWTKKNGTVYWFHADDNGGTGCSIAQAKKGHLQEILARNSNNNITFSYSFVSGYNGAEYVTEIDATHSDGDTLKLVFGVVG